jgi:N-acetyl-gamma-glutamyl-phosphate reductase
VRGSNFCDVAFVEDARNDTWILLSTLDNLCKGASGQAVQCANLMCGSQETACSGASQSLNMTLV